MEVKQQSKPTVVKFGRFELDMRQPLLRKDAKAVQLPAKPLAILVALVESRGETVTRAALKTRLWSEGTHVDFDNNLNASMRKLREALGDSAGRAFYIETVPRQGYRFAAPLQLPPQPVVTSGNRFGKNWLLAVAVLPVVLFLSWWFVQRSGDDQPKPAAMRLAFLPFSCIGEDPSLTAICDGLLEEFINQCGGYRPRELAVIAATSVRQYREHPKTVAQIGEELKVDYVVEGTVQKEAGNLRITVQLVGVTAQAPLWSKVYTGKWRRLFDVRREIGLQVTQALIKQLDVAELPANRGTIDGPAYDALLMARYHLGKNTPAGFQAAANFFATAIQGAPNYAPAHAGLADAYNLHAVYSQDQKPEWAGKALAAAQQALALEAGAGTALAAKALALMTLGRWQDAGRPFEDALHAAPGNGAVHAYAAAWFSAVARHEEAVEAAVRARLLNPLSLNVNRDLAWYHYYAGRFEDALRQSEHVLALDGRDNHLCGLLACWAMENNQAAFDIINHHLLSDEKTREVFAGLRAESETQAEAWLLKRLEKIPGNGQYLYANRLCAAGRLNEAMAVLEHARRQNAPWVIYAAVDAGLKPLHGLDVFRQMVKDLNLPLVWRENEYQYAADNN